MQVYTRPQAAAACVEQGGVLAYPTEGVFGLGCDWQNEAALRRILALKRRPVAQGVILLVADAAMLASVADLSRPALQGWEPEPGTTWLLPSRSAVPPWIRGRHARVAVRIPAWPAALELAAATGPLVSTSANPSGQPAAKNAQQVRDYFPTGLDGLLELPCGPAGGPSPIRDAISGERLR